jgi:hypothetical protein
MLCSQRRIRSCDAVTIRIRRILCFVRFDLLANKVRVQFGLGEQEVELSSLPFGFSFFFFGFGFVEGSFFCLFPSSNLVLFVFSPERGKLSSVVDFRMTHLLHDPTRFGSCILVDSGGGFEGRFGGSLTESIPDSSLSIPHRILLDSKVVSLAYSVHLRCQLGSSKFPSGLTLGMSFTIAVHAAFCRSSTIAKRAAASTSEIPLES